MIKHKFESLDGIYPDIEEYFDQYCDSSSFVDNNSADETTEDCIEYLIDECGQPERIADSDAWFSKIKKYLLALNSSANESTQRSTKSTSKLERRIALLERKFKVEARRPKKKFEGFESDLDESGAHAAADKIINNFSRMLQCSVSPDDLGGDVINSPLYGWLSVDDVDEINEDPDARFVWQYNVDGKYTALVIPSDGTVALLTDGGYCVDPSDGSTFECDDPQSGAFPLSSWSDFDLLMIDDED